VSGAASSSTLAPVDGPATRAAQMTAGELESTLALCAAAHWSLYQTFVRFCALAQPPVK
jgi:hypothetical protein